MVTIVGKSPEHVKECTCRNCSTRLQYTKSEVQYYDDKDWTGSSDRVYFIRCPSCGNKVTVKNY